MKTTLSRLRRAAWLQALAIAVMIPGLVFVSGPVRANPSGGNVTHGAAEIGDGLNGHLMINQLSNRAVINWESFDISPGELTQFNQPGVNAIMLSKVMSGGPSQLYGTLKANGGHILVNPNGIVVGPGGRVDVGGLGILSTLDIDSNQFMRGGPMRFTGNTTAGVTNFGTVTSAGGDVILLGNFVDNQGKLGAINGTVALGAGGEILVGGAGESTISIVRGGAGGGTGVNNAGTITGAAVEMKAHGNVYALAVNNSGAIRATGGGRKGGRVILSAPNGTINNTGSIIAKKANGAGGDITIDATGGEVNIADGEVRADGSGSQDGGTVTVLGDIISVGAPAVVSANGANGGTVTLGSLDGTTQINVLGTVEAIGNSGAGGTIQLLGTPDSVMNVEGNLNASGATVGGTINAQGGQFNQGANSVINAGGGTTGGTVTINARTVNTLGGIIQATGDTESGGDIQLTGDEVMLKTGAVINATGALGEGTINIGGGFQGNVDAIPNATTTTVEKGVQVSADATEGGNGGMVVVWANGNTFFEGDISARALGGIGNGGLIEVSGLENLTVRGSVNAMSVNGKAGAVLFDPGDVVVGNADDAPVDIDSETVNLTLQGGTSVIIATSTGSITFLDTGLQNEWHDAIQWTNSDASFGAFASENLIIETHIRTSGAGSVNLISGWTGTEAQLEDFDFAPGAEAGMFNSVLGLISVEDVWQEFVENGQFGDRSNIGNIFIGADDLARHVVVGSRYGNTNVAGGDLLMVAPQNNVNGSIGTPESRFIHLGFRDTGNAFTIRDANGFANARLDLNERALETNNDPIVGILDPQFYRDINGDGVADGVYGINSSGVLDERNLFDLKQNDSNNDGNPDVVFIGSHNPSMTLRVDLIGSPNGMANVDIDGDGIDDVRIADQSVAESYLAAGNYDWNGDGVINASNVTELMLTIDVNRDGDTGDTIDEDRIVMDLNGDGDVDDRISEASMGWDLNGDGDTSDTIWENATSNNIQQRIRFDLNGNGSFADDVKETEIAIDLNNDGDFDDTPMENTIVGFDINFDGTIDGTQTVIYRQNLRLLRGFSATEGRNYDVTGDGFNDQIAQYDFTTNAAAPGGRDNRVDLSLFYDNTNETNSIANLPDPTLIPFANHLMSSRTGNYWWQQIDGLAPDPSGLGGNVPEMGAGRDPLVTGNPTSRADINVALAGGLLQKSGGRHHNYVQVGHGGAATGWADDMGRRDSNQGAHFEGETSRNYQYNAGRDWSGTGIGRLAGVFGNINILAGVDPTTVLFDPADPEINLTGVTDSQGGFVRLESYQNPAPANAPTNPNSGGADFSYTQIGHLGSGQIGYAEGDINVKAGGNIQLLAGAGNRGHSTIGHTLQGLAIWNPPANEHQQIRFAYDLGDTDNPNLRKGELFLHANGVDNARGFYAPDSREQDLQNPFSRQTVTDVHRWDPDFWDSDGDYNDNGWIDREGNDGADTLNRVAILPVGNVPHVGVTGTPAAMGHPDGPVHVPALVGGTKKDIIGDIRVESFGPNGIEIRGHSNQDTRTRTGDTNVDPDGPGPLVARGDINGDSLVNGGDLDGLLRRNDRRFAGIGHGGTSTEVGTDLDGERVLLRIQVGDINDTLGLDPGETDANLASGSAEVIGNTGYGINRTPTFLNILGDIEVTSHNSGVTIAAGNDTYDYAYIGHGGLDLADYETSSVIIGDITVTGAGDLTMLGSATVSSYTGETARSQQSYTQIGHHGREAGAQLFAGDIAVNFEGDINMVGARVGFSPVKIGHQSYFGYGQSGGTLNRQEHFVYGPQIEESSVTFSGVEVTDTEAIIGFGTDVAAADYTTTYAINGNTSNITVNAGGNILMTHADPQLRTTQNMVARNRANTASDFRWSPVAIGNGSRQTDALASDARNRLYFFADKTGDISVTAGSFQVETDQAGDPIIVDGLPVLRRDANGDPILNVDANGDPVGNITLQNGSAFAWHTNIGHYFSDAANANGPDIAANAYRMIGDINVTAYNDLTLDSSFASAYDPSTIVATVGNPIQQNPVRIGHGALWNAVDVVVLDDGSDVHGIAASSDINITVGNNFDMGFIRPGDDAGDGFHEDFKTDLENRLGLELFHPDNDPLAVADDETYGGYTGSFSQVGHGWWSTNGGQDSRPNGLNGDITINVVNDFNLTAGADAFTVDDGLSQAPIPIEGHVAVVGHGGYQNDADGNGDIGVYVGNNLNLNGSQRVQGRSTNVEKDAVGSVGNFAKIGHWAIDVDLIPGRNSVDANYTGDIQVVVGNDLTMRGGTVPDLFGPDGSVIPDGVVDINDYAQTPIIYAFTQIGHSGPGVEGEKSGNIEVLVQNAFNTIDGISGETTVIDPSDARFVDDPDDDNDEQRTLTSNANAYVMIGNGDWSREGSSFSQHGGNGPGARRGDIRVLVGDSADFDHTLIGHADPGVVGNDVTITLGDTFIGVSRNFPFFDTPAGTPEGSGNLVARNGSVFTSAFYGLGSQLRIYVPQRENNLMEIDDPMTPGNEGTRLNSVFAPYIGTPQAGAVNGVGGESFVDHIGGTFDSSLGAFAGRDDEIYLQPDLWWDDTAVDTFGGTTGIFPESLVDVEGGTVATVGAPGGAPSIVTLDTGDLGDGTDLDGGDELLNYQTVHTQTGLYTIYYDAIEPVGITVQGPVDDGGTGGNNGPGPTLPTLPPTPSLIEPFFLPETVAFEIPFVAPALDIFALLGLVDATKYDAWDRDTEGAFGVEDNTFYQNIGLFGLIYGPGGLVSENENIEITTGNTLIDSLGVILGLETIGMGEDEMEEQEKRAARFSSLGKTYLIQYRQLLNTGQLNRYNSANVFSGNGL